MSVLDALPEAPTPVPTCPYLVRKDQVPDFARRSNILPWNAPLAARPHEWTVLRGADGHPLRELPPMGYPPARTQPVSPIPPPPPVIVNVQQVVPPSPPSGTGAASDDTSGTGDAATGDGNLGTDASGGDTAAMREIQITAAFAGLSGDQLKSDGTPNINIMKHLTGFTDLTNAEVLPLWEKFKNPTDEE